MWTRWPLLALALAACGKHDDGKPAPKPQAVARPVAPAEPPPPTPPPLPVGQCCCAATAKGDELVEVHDQASCTSELGGTCIAAARCWLPDPPAITP